MFSFANQSCSSEKPIHLAANLNLNRSRSGEADLDRRAWLLRIHNHSLIRLHIHELVFNFLVWFQGKFLVLSHFKFPTSAPGIDERRHRLRRRGDLSLYQRDLYMTLLMFEEQL